MIIKLPFKIFGYIAITIWPFIFVWKEKAEYKVLLRHERIHLKQWEELFLIGFIVLYLFFFIVELIKLKNWNAAYRSIPFEKEAYRNQDEDDYLSTRKRMAWIEYG